ncbi:MAG: hypothetical protein LKJ54_03585 [Acetobacter peroxydans]|jgi:hypothetical protein|nr:hypothetical protein [Acetobacter peroxydans]MCI2078545.1 hypothetical protein [Acetobacter peroxydans]
MSRRAISLVVSILGLLFAAGAPTSAHATAMQGGSAMIMHAAQHTLPCHNDRQMAGMAGGYSSADLNVLPRHRTVMPPPSGLTKTDSANACLHAPHRTHEQAMPCCAASGQSPVATAEAYHLAALRPLRAVTMHLPRGQALPAGQGVTPLLPPPRASII